MIASVALLALALLQSPAPSGAPKAPPSPGTACLPAAFHQFDFWIGEWEVSNQQPPPGRTPPASKSRISRILSGCAILEEYETAQGYAGKSLNFHDAQGGRWRQVWIDTGGSPLFLAGGLEGNSMVMRDDGASGAINRITWTPLEGGKVRQLWETSKDQGKTWQVAFDGLYTPRAAR
jgi:hypothetical protein